MVFLAEIGFAAAFVGTGGTGGTGGVLVLFCLDRSHEGSRAETRYMVRSRLLGALSSRLFSPGSPERCFACRTSPGREVKSVGTTVLEGGGIVWLSKSKEGAVAVFNQGLS